MSNNQLKNLYLFGFFQRHNHARGLFNLHICTVQNVSKCSCDSSAHTVCEVRAHMQPLYTQLGVLLVEVEGPNQEDSNKKEISYLKTAQHAVPLG